MAIFLIYEECIFGLFGFKQIPNMAYLIFFNIFFSSIIHIFTSMFSVEKYNYRFSMIIVFLILIIYVFQFIYLKANNTMFTLRRDDLDYRILIQIIINWYVIILMIIPIFIFKLIYSKKGIEFNSISVKQKIKEICIGILAQLIGIMIITNINNDNNLYFNQNNTDEMARKFGIVTTTRVDIQKYIIGFEE